MFENPNNQQEKQALNDLTSADLKATLEQFINSSFKFKQQLRLTFGSEDGPLYDSDENEISIPFQFVIDAKARFDAVASSDDNELSPEDATVDAVIHTVFHELAHALIFMNEIPIVGKEEDAADSLATILLIDYFEDGQELALSAAELFGLESSDIEEFEEQDFADEHSLAAQRYYQTLCYIYGSDPDNYESILDLADFSADRAQLCEEEYLNASNNWQQLLAQVFKAPVLKAQPFEES